MKVKELVLKLQSMPPDADVFLQDAGEPHYGSELTGLMFNDDAEAEDVREINGGVLITKY